MSESDPINPFASPAVQSPAARIAVVRSHNGDIALYQSGRKRAIVAIIALAAVAAVCVLWICYDIREFVNASVKFSRVASTIDYEADEFHWRCLVLASFVVQIVQFATYLAWVHRVYKNLPALGARALRQTPLAAIGWYLIPLAKWVKPCQGMFDIAGGSDPHGLQQPGGMADGTRPPISWWWMTWMLSIVFAYAQQILSLTADWNHRDYVQATNLALVNALLLGASSLLTIYVIWKIDAMQTERAALLGVDDRATEPTYEDD